VTTQKETGSTRGLGVRLSGTDSFLRAFWISCCISSSTLSNQGAACPSRPFFSRTACASGGRSQRRSNAVARLREALASDLSRLSCVGDRSGDDDQALRSFQRRYRLCTAPSECHDSDGSRLHFTAHGNGRRILGPARTGFSRRAVSAPLMRTRIIGQRVGSLAPLQSGKQLGHDPLPAPMISNQAPS
jgi:hypothetical protein